MARPRRAENEALSAAEFSALLALPAASWHSFRPRFFAMSQHEFEINVADLDAAGRDYHFPVRAAWLRGIFEGTDLRAGTHDGALDVRASKSGNDVVVHGTLKAEVVTACARCLNDAVVKVDGPFSILMVPAKGKRVEDDDENLELDEADVVPYEGETAVLDDVVKDEILLEIPMIPLCSEDCPGMSPQAVSPDAASKEPAIDPRLAPLLEIKKSQQQKKSQEKKERKG